MCRSRVAPATGNQGRVRGDVLLAHQAEARLLDQSLVDPGRYEEEEADRAPSGELVVGHRAGDEDRIREDRATAGTEDARPLLEDGQPIGEVIHEWPHTAFLKSGPIRIVNFEVERVSRDQRKEEVPRIDADSTKHAPVADVGPYPPELLEHVGPEGVAHASRAIQDLGKGPSRSMKVSNSRSSAARRSFHNARIPASSATWGGRCAPRDVTTGG